MDTKLIEAIEALKPQMQGWFEYLHTHPELSGAEQNTAAYIGNLLESWGFEVARNIGGHGLVATLRAGSGERAIALRSELDALPIQEDGSCRVVSKTPGVSHLCGHDGHMVMLLGAAQYLAETRNFNGTLRLVYQPAEENFSGAQAMIDDGLFERFPVDAIFGMHNSPNFPERRFYLSAGPILTAADYIRITVTGNGAHGAFPHMGTDPIVAASSIVMALQTIVARNLDPKDTGVITVGQFHAGTAENIIPNEAVLDLSIRSASTEARNVLIPRIEALAKAQAASFGATATLEHIRTGAVVENDAALKDEVAAAVVERLGAENFDLGGMHEMASEDFAFYNPHVPGFYAFLGNGNTPVNHNPGYTFCENDFTAGAAYWVALAEGLLK